MVDFVRPLLEERGRNYAIPLYNAIEARAARDMSYARSFDDWLRYGGTIIFRDELSRPFRDAAFVNALRGAFAYPWQEC